MNESHKKSFFRYLLIFSLLFSSMAMFTVLMLQGENSNRLDRSIVYNLKTNFELNHFNQKPNLYIFEQVIINSQSTINQEQNRFIPYQETVMLSNWVKGNYSSVAVRKDRFQNKLLVITANLSSGETVSASSEYEITITEVDFESAKPIEIIGEDTRDEIYALYSNQNDTYYQGSNQELINLSYNIVGNETDSIKIARKIVTWISTNIKYSKYSYKFYIDMSWGALETFQTREGVCWDFSELMVTLLRIQHIPARTVIGFVLDKNEPKEGDIFEFYYNWKNKSYESNPLSLHAWVEYFVPEYGWLASDPTWSDAGLTYFNELDVIHFRFGAGAWFSMPISPFWEGSYLSLYPISLIPRNSSEYNFTIKITVMESILEVSLPLPIIIKGNLIFICLPYLIINIFEFPMKKYLIKTIKLKELF